eukprot:3933065-Rhodomonas_salina.3
MSSCKLSSISFLMERTIPGCAGQYSSDSGEGCAGIAAVSVPRQRWKMWDSNSQLLCATVTPYRPPAIGTLRLSRLMCCALAAVSIHDIVSGVRRRDPQHGHLDACRSLMIAPVGCGMSSGQDARAQSPLHCRLLGC